MASIAKSIFSELLTYDIIVSDFGREASVEYLRLAAVKERHVIQSLLRLNNLEFFDEYRRIMFSMIGDVAFFKKSMISQVVNKNGYLTDEVLIGLGQTDTTAEFEKNVIFCVLQEVMLAVDRGYNEIRVVIPCNTLSTFTFKIGRLLNDLPALQAIADSFDRPVANLENITKARITVHTVPEAVIELASREMNTHLLLLGTAHTNEIYKRLCGSTGLTVIDLDHREQKLIDQAIVGSIGGDTAEMAKHRNELMTELVNPRQMQNENLLVIEACTDFKLNIGLSSLEIFAHEMVSKCYSNLINSHS
jgi:hypothetical protein